MKRQISVIVAFVCVFALTGCSVYSGSTTDVPLFRERGELQAEVGVCPTPYVIPIPYAATASYSLTDHVGFSATADWARRYWQAMCGFYQPVGDKFVCEAFGGFAMGWDRVLHYDNYSPDGMTVRGDYRMPFVQIDCGWRDLTRILHPDLAFAVRVGGIYGDVDRSWTEYVGETGYHRHTHFEGMRALIEPSVELRFGWDHFKFNFQVYLTYILDSHGKPDNMIPANAGGYNFGISYRFDTRRNR